jgi:predicted nucleotidyltransferase
VLRTKNEIIKIAEEYGKVLDELFDGVELRLFGSYHKNKQTINSDIDIAVISNDFENIEYLTSLKLLNRLKLKVDRSIEPISMTKKDIEQADIGSIEYEVSKNSDVVFRSKF